MIIYKYSYIYMYLLKKYVETLIELNNILNIQSLIRNEISKVI